MSDFKISQVRIFCYQFLNVCGQIVVDGSSKSHSECLKPNISEGTEPDIHVQHGYF